MGPIQRSAAKTDGRVRGRRQRQRCILSNTASSSPINSSLRKRMTRYTCASSQAVRRLSPPILPASRGLRHQFRSRVLLHGSRNPRRTGRLKLAAKFHATSCRLRRQAQSLHFRKRLFAANDLARVVDFWFGPRIVLIIAQGPSPSHAFGAGPNPLPAKAGRGKIRINTP